MGCKSPTKAELCFPLHTHHVAGPEGCSGLLCVTDICNVERTKLLKFQYYNLGVVNIPDKQAPFLSENVGELSVYLGEFLEMLISVTEAKRVFFRLDYQLLSEVYPYRTVL